MDPVTIVGLVTNVVQLVDVSWKIVSKSREIQRAGAVPEQRDTQTVTADLQRINTKLLRYLSISEAEKNLSDDDRSLQLLCESSNRIASELLARLGAVSIGDEHRRWKSLRQALKSVWIKAELDETAARLQSYRTQLNTRMLVSLHDQVNAIVQSNRNIASSIQDGRVAFANGQEIQTDYLTRFIASQHDKTRDLLSTLTLSGAPPAYAIAIGKETPSPNNGNTDMTFKAIADGDIPQIRRILRENPQAVISFNQSGKTLLHVAARKGDPKMVAYLVRNGASINPDDDDGRLPIHAAAEAGSEPVVRLLIDKGADPDAKDMTGKTALDLCDSWPLLRWIMLYGAKIEAKNEAGHTALYHFASQGNLGAVRQLVEQNATINATSSWNASTPLWVASDNGHVDVVAYLLTQGAGVNARDSRQSTPLIGAGWNGHQRVGELLLDHGADIEAANQHRFTALHECLDHGHADMARMLLARGAKANVFNEFGYAPLHQASMHGHVEVVRMILERGGIDVNLLNPRARWTPLAEACNHGHLAVVKQLLAYGAKTEVGTDQDHRTALMRAAEHGFAEIVQYLLEDGAANADAADDNGKTALYIAVLHCRVTTDANTARFTAVQRGLFETTRVLLKHVTKNTINKPDQDDYTSLCRAAQHGHAELIRMLIDAGADIDLPGRDRWTPLHEATWHHRTNAVKVLLDYGARVDVFNSSGKSAIDFTRMRPHKSILEAFEKHASKQNTSASAKVSK